MKLALALALLILFAATPVSGRDIVLPLPEGEVASPDAQAATREWRATQVNRCLDAKGKVTLQDLPCNPVAADARPGAVAEAGDVTELAALEPRPPSVVPPPAVPAELPSHGFARALAIGAGKLGLLLVAGYAIVRLLRGLRDLYRHARPGEEKRGYSPRRVR